MEIKVEDVIKEEFLESHLKELKFIYEQLFRVRNMLFIAERIIEFPFRLLSPLPEGSFWFLITSAIFDSIILKIWALTSDSDSEFRLRRFKNKIMTNWKREDIDEGIDEVLKISLKEVDFENRISKIEDKITSIRNHHVAHFDYNSKMGVGDDVVEYRVEFKELNDIVSALHDLYNTLSFDTYSELLEIRYLGGQQNNSTDIDKLLTLVASQSMYLTNNHPPHPIHKQIQEERINQLSEENQAIVESWRKRINQLYPYIK